MVPASRVFGAVVNELTDCHSESRLTLEAENLRVVWAALLLGGRADAVDFLRPLVDEDVQLCARVVGFPDDSLQDHIVAVPPGDRVLRVVHVQMLYGCQHDVPGQLVFPEHKQQEDNHH